MDRAGILTRHLKAHDSQLFAEKHDGVIHVFRKTRRYEPIGWNEGTLLYSYEEKKHVMSLTDNWGMRGNPVDWGIEPVISRIKEIDGWNRSVVDEILATNEKVHESKMRDNKNKNEDFLRELRRPFAKAFNDFNVSGMKRDNRYKGDK